jgi:hypothetical protein
MKPYPLSLIWVEFIDGRIRFKIDSGEESFHLTMEYFPLIAEHRRHQAEAKPAELHRWVEKDRRSSLKLTRPVPLPEEPCSHR